MDIETFATIAIPILVVALFSSIIPRKLKERENAALAAKEFRGVVINSTKGLYPVIKPWPGENCFAVFKASTNDIRSAAAEFSRHVSRKRKFDKAIAEYCEYCKNAYQSQQGGWELYTSTRKERGEPEPKKEFERIVNHLLSFADKN